MLIAELTIYIPLKPMANFAPFVYSWRPGRRTTAPYWTTTFGAQGDDSTEEINVTSFLENPNIRYRRVFSVADCIATEQSFYWDNINQVGYSHITHTSWPDYTLYSIGLGQGFTDSGVVYIEGEEFLPYIRGVPRIAQKADMVNYDRLAFISGTVSFDNVDSYFDQYITKNIYGNDLNLYYLDSTITEPRRSDLINLSSFYIEDYSFSISAFDVRVQDKRKSQNSKILTAVTLRGEDVPLIYGPVRTAKCLINEAEGATGIVSYRAGVTLTNIGTIQTFDEDTKKWVNVTANTTDLANGSFTLTAAVGREDGTASGTPKKVRLLAPVGIPNTTVADVIIDLNQRVLGIGFNESFYDIQEWTLESAMLDPVGVVLGQMELYEAIRLLQNGANIGFRYEIRPDGYRTIRIDNWLRTPTYYAQLATGDGVLITAENGDSIWAFVPREEITVIDIKDNKTLSINTDSSIFFASAKIRYNKDWNEGTFLSTTNTDYQQAAFDAYRQKPEITVDTFLTNEVDAIARGTWTAQKLSEIRPVLSCELHGPDYYELRIYDTLYIDLTNNGRQYFGRWKAQIIGIDPQFGALSNKVTMILTERVV